MPLTHRQNLLDCRRRKRQGLSLLKVEANMGLLADFLVDQGLVKEDDTEDDAKVRDAFAKFVRSLIEDPDDSA